MMSLETLISEILKTTNKMNNNSTGDALSPSMTLMFQTHAENGNITRVSLAGSGFISYLIRAEDLRNLPKDLLAELSTSAGVYMLIEGITFRYVGESDAEHGVYSRLINHLGYKQFDYAIITISANPYYQISSIRTNIEDYFIVKYRPLDNKAKGHPSRLNSYDQFAFSLVCYQLELLLSRLMIKPNPVLITTSNDIKDKMINSSNAPRAKKATRGLISDMKLNKGQEIVFTLDRNIHAFVLNNGNIRIYGSNDQYTDQYTLTSFCTTWNLETGKKKPGEVNTMAGPEYWETLDGVKLSLL